MNVLKKKENFVKFTDWFKGAGSEFRLMVFKWTLNQEGKKDVYSSQKFRSLILGKQKK